MSRQHCCDLRRRDAVAAHPTLNGIDWIEVLDRDLPAHDPLRQRTLLVRTIRAFDPALIPPSDGVSIEGGERLRDVRVQWVARAEPLPPELSGPGEAAVRTRIQAMSDADRTQTLVVRCAAAGDFSTYRLRLRASATEAGPWSGFDPRLSAIEFRFKVECNPEFDCRDVAGCEPPVPAPQDIDYLARDYASLRRLLLDRIAQKAPQWKLDAVPDGAMALVELLAYVGDQLSYRQDAVATEAYLDTARRRISLRRHARLVDYAVYEGCNARTFVHLRLRADVPGLVLPTAGTQFLTRCPDLAPAFAPASPAHEAARRAAPLVFEPMQETRLFADHNELRFHTWSDRQCCLPRGATQASLVGSHWDLRPGDFLLFEEVLGPRSGLAADADPGHRHVVRLTRVEQGRPAADGNPAVPMLDPLDGTPVCEIAWGAEDALPFPLCLSSVTDDAHGAVELTAVSVARGNLVLADHGERFVHEDLGQVPAPSLFGAVHAARCAESAPRPLPVRYRPRLARGPLTFAAPVPDAQASAAACLRVDAAEPMPQLSLNGGAWRPCRDLLKAHKADPLFVVEVDDEQRAQLRFGDDRYGRRPESGTAFEAAYRVGQGTAGNVGAEALVHLVCADFDAIEAVRNPLAAVGGRDPESRESVRRRAPQAFRIQERAVTEADYAQVTQRHAGVQRAQARLRWTGSWHTVFVAVDRQGGAPLSEEYESQLVAHVDRYRMAGHDLEFDEPVYVPLGLSLHVCVKPDYFRAHVKAALLEVLGSRRLCDGRLGLFHPDRFSFGQTVFLSPIYAAAHAVPGVDSVRVTAFGPQGTPNAKALADGKLELGRLQIARLDNDPNFPERGRLTLELDGGK